MDDSMLNGTVDKLETRVRPKITRSDVQRVVAAWARRQHSEARPMGRLARPYKTVGENMHWHITGPRKGMATVEVTYLPSRGTLAVLVHDNRGGSWAGEAYKALGRQIERSIGQPER